MADTELLRRLPSIGRARDYHLYDLHGKRYLDLWLDGGRALLGHRPEGVVGEMKNVLARGLYGELPSIYERRLLQALARLLPGHAEFRLYRGLDRLLEAVRPIVGEIRAAEIVDPARPESTPSSVRSGAHGRIAWWRPFAEAGEPGPGVAGPAGGASTEPAPAAALALPIIPLEGCPVAVAAFREVPPPEVPPSDLLSPVLLAAMAKSIHLLIRFRARYTEDLWRRYDSPAWNRVGPYLTARCTEEEYSILFERLLERGILIAPRYPGPSVVPAIAADGELVPLRELTGMR